MQKQDRQIFDYMMIVFFKLFLAYLTVNVANANTFVKGINNSYLVEEPTSTASAGSTTTLTSVSNTVQVFTGLLTQTVVLPNATTLPNGRKFFISSQTTGALTVQSNGGGTLTSILALESASFRLINNSTAAGSWDVEFNYYGGGTGLLPLLNGGTGTALANGTANQIIQSNGNGTVSWSTATFPSTATSTGTLLRANGTNWVPTTATYPNTAGTTGTILRADGTNWTASTTTWPDTIAAPAALIATSANAVTSIQTGSANRFLHWTGAAFGWDPVNLSSTDITGTLPVANGGTGASTFTLGSVVFAGTSGVYTEDNTNFFWDDTNNSLGIGTNAPGATFKLNLVGPQLINNSSDNALVVGPNGSSNPALRVDTNAGSANTGILVQGDSALVSITTISGSAAAGLLMTSKGTATAQFGASGIGNVNILTNGNARAVWTGVGTLTLSPATSTGNLGARFKANCAADTALTASSEQPCAQFAMTAVRQHSTGTLALQRDLAIDAGTHGFVGASTLTDAATVGVSGAPIGGTNATITNAHGILVQAGALTSTTSGYGLTVNAPTGATTNYAAQFLGGIVGIGLSAPVSALHIDRGTATSGHTRYTANATTGQSATDGFTVGITSAAVAEVRQYENLAFNTYTNNLLRSYTPAAGGLVVGDGAAALSTSATDGFLYIPTSAGTPVGTPTTQTGSAPVEIDTTNNVLQFYSGGAWRSTAGLSNPMTTVGDIIYGGASGVPTRLASGTTAAFTPTLTNGTNVAASTSRESWYIRIGSNIIWGGRVDIDPTLSANTTELGISLPVASDFALDTDAAGQCNNTGGSTRCFINADVTNNRLLLSEIPTAPGNETVYYTVVYTIK